MAFASCVEHESDELFFHISRTNINVAERNIWKLSFLILVSSLDRF